MKYLHIVTASFAALVACGACAVAPAPQGGATPVKGDVKAGAVMFEASCEACHANGIGPSLRGVIGRPVASVADFPSYTGALKAKAGETWTEARLDAFLTDAQIAVPGTAMTVIMPDPQERADVIAYLANLP